MEYSHEQYTPAIYHRELKWTINSPAGTLKTLSFDHFPFRLASFTGWTRTLYEVAGNRSYRFILITFAGVTARRSSCVEVALAARAASLTSYFVHEAPSLVVSNSTAFPSLTSPTLRRTDVTEEQENLPWVTLPSASQYASCWSRSSTFSDVLGYWVCTVSNSMTTTS